MTKNKVESKRFGFVANTSWSIYNFRFGVIQKLAAMGHYVLVIAPKDQFSTKIIAKGIDFQNLDLDNYGTNPFRDMRTLMQLRSIYRKYELDFIFHYTIKPNIYGSLAARTLGIPCIAVTTGLGHLFSRNSKLIQMVAVSLYRFAVKRCKEVWFLNDSDRKLFIKKRIVRENQAFKLNSEGVNTRIFAPLSFDLEKRREIRFLFAGRILWEKGIGEFVDAAQRIRQRYPEARFQILGFIDPQNPDSVPISQIAEWQKSKIISYLGETTQVKPFIAEADCLVLPTTYREGISRILLEAASMAKPIITTDNVGCREVVEDGTNGFLCRPGSVADLQRKIEQFIFMSEDQRFHMGWAGRKKVMAEFDEKYVIAEYIRKLEHYFSRVKPRKLRRPDYFFKP